METIAHIALESASQIVLYDDEFGRNYFVSLSFSICLSVARALLMSGLLLLFALVLAVFVVVVNNRWVTGITQIVVDALESVPVYVWILAAISWSNQGGYVLVALVFSVAGLPLCYNFIYARAREIQYQVYYFSAIALGAGRWRLSRYHILPNLLPSCGSLVIHIFGSAMAVYGAVGLFGFVNREEYDLGVMLLRGKEQAALTIVPLVLATIGYGFVFIVLYFGVKRFDERRFNGVG
ncbi:MAG: ABC transporter permease subunit [Pseudomonadota bacterium]